MTRLRLFVSLLIVAALLIPVEWLVARVKGSGEARHDTIAGDYIPVRLKPGFSGVVANLHFTTNRYGFRGREDFPVPPPSGERRILSLGDSVGFGWGIELRQHYTKVLERELEKSAAKTNWRVINAAGQGYSPSSYHAYLREEGLRFKPDLVLVQVEFCNDVSDEALLCWRGRDSTGGPRVVRGGRYAVAWDGNLLGTAGWGFPQERTYTYTLLLRRLLLTWWDWWPRGPLAQPQPPPYFNLGFDRPLLGLGALEAGWQQLFESLDASRRLAQQHHIRWLLLMVPPRYVFEPPANPRTAQARQILERAIGLARQRNLPFLTFVEELRQAGGAARYLDFAHPDALGNRVIGELLAQQLASGLRE